MSPSMAALTSRPASRRWCSKLGAKPTSSRGAASPSATDSEYESASTPFAFGPRALIRGPAALDNGPRPQRVVRGRIGTESGAPLGGSQFVLVFGRDAGGVIPFIR